MLQAQRFFNRGVLNYLLGGQTMNVLRIKILFILIVILISGCKGTPQSSKSNPQKFLSEQQGTIEKKDSSKNNYSNSNKSSIPKEQYQFFGEWVIGKPAAYGRISAYGEEEIKGFQGKQITYSNKVACFSGNFIEDPWYKISRVSRNDFFAGNYVDLRELGVKENNITKVEVFVNKDFSNPWRSTGRFFFVKDSDHLILYDQGVYFELLRKKN